MRPFLLAIILVACELIFVFSAVALQTEPPIRRACDYTALAPASAAAQSQAARTYAHDACVE